MDVVCLCVLLGGLEGACVPFYLIRLCSGFIPSKFQAHFVRTAFTEMFGSTTSCIDSQPYLALSDLA